MSEKLGQPLPLNLLLRLCDFVRDANQFQVARLGVPQAECGSGIPVSRLSHAPHIDQVAPAIDCPCLTFARNDLVSIFPVDEGPMRMSDKREPCIRLANRKSGVRCVKNIMKIIKGTK